MRDLSEWRRAIRRLLIPCCVVKPGWNRQRLSIHPIISRFVFAPYRAKFNCWMLFGRDMFNPDPAHVDISLPDQLVSLFLPVTAQDVGIVIAVLGMVEFP